MLMDGLVVLGAGAGGKKGQTKVEADQGVQILPHRLFVPSPLTHVWHLASLTFSGL